VISYTKVAPDAGESLIIVVNLDHYHTQGGHIRVPLHQFGIGYDQPYLVRDMLSGEKYKWRGEYNYVQMNPFEMPAHILSVERLN
jgi:starch synthase (maltosyl-transferring)